MNDQVWGIAATRLQGTGCVLSCAAEAPLLIQESSEGETSRCSEGVR